MGPRVFLKFAVDAGGKGVLPALEKHYGMGLADLEREWLSSLDG
jgi:hypothetical protein